MYFGPVCKGLDFLQIPVRPWWTVFAQQGQGESVQRIIGTKRACVKSRFVLGTIRENHNELHRVILITDLCDGGRAISGPALLLEAALRAVSQWRQRTHLDGQPVSIRMHVTVKFHLE
jgi:hypothetical protein